VAVALVHRLGEWQLANVMLTTLKKFSLSVRQFLIYIIIFAEYVIYSVVLTGSSSEIKYSYFRYNDCVW